MIFVPYEKTKMMKTEEKLQIDESVKIHRPNNIGLLYPVKQRTNFRAKTNIYKIFYSTNINNV